MNTLRIVTQLVASLPPLAGMAAQDTLQTKAAVGDLGISSVTSAVRATNGMIYVTGDRGIYVVDPRGSSPTLVYNASASDITVSPRGTLLAFVRYDAEPSIWTLAIDSATGRATGQARRVSIRSGRAPAFSPDSRYIAFSVLPANDTLVGARVVRVPAGGGPEEVISREPGYAQSLRWSPDGRWIYYRHGVATASRRKRTLRRVAASGGSAQVLGSVGEFIGLSPDGSRLAYITNMQFHRDTVKTIVIADAHGTEVQRFQLVGSGQPIAWGADGELLVLQPKTRRSLRRADVVDKVTELLPLRSGERAHLSTDERNVLLESSAPRSALVRFDVSTGRHDTIVVSPRGDTLLRWVDERFAVRWAQDTAVGILELPAARLTRLEACEAILGIAAATRVICLGQSRDTLREVLATDLRGGERRRLRNIPFPKQYRPNVVLAGENKLVVTYGGRVMVTDLSDGSLDIVHSAATGGTPAAGVVGVSDDGRWLAFLAESGGSLPRQQQLHVVSIDGSSRRSVPLPGISISPSAPPAWSSDERFVAVVGESSGGDAIVLVPLAGDLPVVIAREGFGIELVAVTTSGAIIYTMTQDAFALLTAPIPEQRKR